MSDYTPAVVAASEQLQAQRARVKGIFTNSPFRTAIKAAVERGDLLLKPDLDISCDVGAHSDIIGLLGAFDPFYLRLVLEAIFNVQTDYTDDVKFAEHLTAIAAKHIFTSPAIHRNKRFTYSGGKWLTDAGKEAVKCHFLVVMCQILYLMEQCLINEVIPGARRMFRPDMEFQCISDAISFLSREFISGKTLLPKVLESAGFKAYYNDLSPPAPLPRRRRPSAEFLLAHATNTFEEARPADEMLPAAEARPADETRPADEARTFDKTRSSDEVRYSDGARPSAETQPLQESQNGNETRRSIDVSQHFNPILAMFEELKKTAAFIYEFASKSGISNEQIAILKEQIDNLLLDLNESIIQAADHLHESTMGHADTFKGPILNGTYIVNKTLDSTRQDLPYGKLFALYNEALKKVVDFEAQTAQLADSFNNLQNQNAELMGQIDSTTKEKAQLTDKLNDFQNRNAELERQIVAMEDDKKQLVEKLNDAQSQNAELADQVADFNAEKTQLSDELKDAQSQNVELTAQIADVNAEKTQLAERLNELQSQNAELERQVDAVENDFKQLSDKLEEMRDHNTELAAQVADFKAENTHLTDKLDELKNQNAELLHQRDSVEKENTQLADELNELKNQNAYFARQLDSVEKEKKDLEDELRAALREVSEKEGLENAVHALNNRNTEYSAQIASLEDEKQELEVKLQSALRELAEEKAKSTGSVLKERNTQPSTHVASQSQQLLAPDLGDKVTAELKRIYSTLHNVKSNTENIRKA